MNTTPMRAPRSRVQLRLEQLERLLGQFIDEGIFVNPNDAHHARMTREAVQNLRDASEPT